MNQNNLDELQRLRDENVRLRALLTRHGIVFDEPNQKVSLSIEEYAGILLLGNDPQLLYSRCLYPICEVCGSSPILPVGQSKGDLTRDLHSAKSP